MQRKFQYATKSNKYSAPNLGPLMTLVRKSLFSHWFVNHQLEKSFLFGVIASKSIFLVRLVTENKNFKRGNRKIKDFIIFYSSIYLLCTRMSSAFNLRRSPLIDFSSVEDFPQEKGNNLFLKWLFGISEVTRFFR